MNNQPNPQDYEPMSESPSAPEAEELALGSPLINDKAFSEIAFLIKDDFFILRNAFVFEAMRRVHDRGDSVEYMTVIEELRRMGKLQEVGGAAYITHLASNVATSVHAESYAHIVQAAAIRRRMIKAAAEINTCARNEEMDLQESITAAQMALDSVTARTNQNDWLHVQEIASDYFDTIQDRYTNKTTSDGILTGLTGLDRMLRGWHKSRLYIVGARPGMGKTWFMLQCTLEAAKQRKKVGIVSMEMDRQELINRLMSLMTGINALKIDEGDLTESEWEKFTTAYTEFQKLDIFIDDSGYQTPRGLRNKCKRLHVRYGLDILFVDYLQLAHGDDEKQGSYERLSAFSRALAALTKPDALNIPIIALAQLNRNLEDRTDKRPMLSDLRESGQIEQDASVVLFLYRDVEYNPNSTEKYVCEIIVAKNRHNGGKFGKGTSKVFYDLENPSFTNIDIQKVSIKDAF